MGGNRSPSPPWGSCCSRGDGAGGGGGVKGKESTRQGSEKGHLGIFSADTLPKPTAEPLGAGRGLPAWRVRPARPSLVALWGIFVPDFGQFASQEAPAEGPFLWLPQVAAIVTRWLPGALTRFWGGDPLVQPRRLLPLGSKEIPKAGCLLGGGWLGRRGSQRAGEGAGTGTSVWGPFSPCPAVTRTGTPNPPPYPPSMPAPSLLPPSPAPWI